MASTVLRDKDYESSSYPIPFDFDFGQEHAPPRDSTVGSGFPDDLSEGSLSAQTSFIDFPPTPASSSGRGDHFCAGFWHSQSPNPKPWKRVQYLQQQESPAVSPSKLRLSEGKHDPIPPWYSSSGLPSTSFSVYNDGQYRNTPPNFASHIHHPAMKIEPNVTSRSPWLVATSPRTGDYESSIFNECSSMFHHFNINSHLQNQETHGILKFPEKSLEASQGGAANNRSKIRTIASSHAGITPAQYEQTLGSANDHLSLDPSLSLRSSCPVPPIEPWGQPEGDFGHISLGDLEGLSSADIAADSITLESQPILSTEGGRDAHRSSVRLKKTRPENSNGRYSRSVSSGSSGSHATLSGSGRPPSRRRRSAPASSSAKSAKQASKGARSLKSSVSGTSAHAGQKSDCFINYFPSHRDKILTAVAPSGSSKTKARREREQRERQREWDMKLKELSGKVGS